MPDSIEHLVDRIDQAARDYQPGQHVLDSLRQVTMTAVIGPSAIGKNTIMNAAASFDSDFACVTGFTTRSRRPNEPEDTYRFLEHSADVLESILAQIENQELVQVTVHPTTGNVYGSALIDYAKPYMMLDTLPNAIQNLEALPFKALRKVVITAEPTTWAKRRQARDMDGPPEAAALRLHEGIANLRWSIEQGDDVVWLENGERSARETAQQFIDIVKYGNPGDQTVHSTGTKLLTYMESIAAAA